MTINIITTISIFLISSILFYLVNKFFKFRIKRGLKTLLNFVIIIVSLPLIAFFGLSVIMDYQLDETRIVEVRSSINCNDQNYKFLERFGKFKQYYISKELKRENYSLSMNKKENGIMGIIFPKYTTYFYDYSSPDLEQINLKQKQTLNTLLNCTNYDLDTLYYKDIESLSCYIANYSKVTDYPDCSPEIKAKFGLR